MMTGVGEDDRGPWAATASGRRFHPLNFDPDCVNLEDVARSLANTCRFGGHVERFYSVAEHSVNCSILAAEQGLDADIAREALLHETVEAYVGDNIRPLKVAIPKLVEIEDEIYAAIAERIGLPPTMSPEVRAIDDLMLAAESKVLLTRCEKLPDLPEPDLFATALVRGHTPHDSLRVFTARCNALGVSF